VFPARDGRYEVGPAPPGVDTWRECRRSTVGGALRRASASGAAPYRCRRCPGAIGGGPSGCWWAYCACCLGRVGPAQAGSDRRGCISAVVRAPCGVRRAACGGGGRPAALVGPEAALVGPEAALVGPEAALVGADPERVTGPVPGDHVVADHVVADHVVGNRVVGNRVVGARAAPRVGLMAVELPGSWPTPGQFASPAGRIACGARSGRAAHRLELSRAGGAGGTHRAGGTSTSHRQPTPRCPVGRRVVHMAPNHPQLREPTVPAVPMARPS